MTEESKSLLYVRAFPERLKRKMAEEAEANVVNGGPFRGQREILVDALERRYREQRREKP